MDILLEKSLVDCHCEGVDSLVIKDAPNMVRIFIAHGNHKLHRNNREGYDKFSVALHRHHCDVTLQPIFGNIWNVRPARKTEEGRTVFMSSYRYVSPITHGQGKFDAVDPAPLPISLAATKIERPLFMEAQDLHTIWVPYGEAAAWYVWEGAENPTHNPIVYSNSDLTKFDFSLLDKPIWEERLKYDLQMIGVRR